MMPQEAASGVETLIGKIGSTLRKWGPLSVPTLSVKLGVAPLHIRDAIEVSDGALVVENGMVDRRESCALTAVESHVANFGSMPLDSLAMALGLSLQAVRGAVRRSRRLELIRQSHSPGAALIVVVRRARSA